MNNDETITISKEEYEELLDSQWRLTCLESAGVDNWSGYYYAMQEYNNGKNEDEEECGTIKLKK